MNTVLIELYNFTKLFIEKKALQFDLALNISNVLYYIELIFYVTIPKVLYAFNLKINHLLFLYHVWSTSINATGFHMSYIFTKWALFQSGGIKHIKWHQDSLFVYTIMLNIVNFILQIYRSVNHALMVSDDIHYYCY